MFWPPGPDYVPINICICLADICDWVNYNKNGFWYSFNYSGGSEYHFKCHWIKLTTEQRRAGGGIPMKGEVIHWAWWGMSVRIVKGTLMLLMNMSWTITSEETHDERSWRRRKIQNSPCFPNGLLKSKVDLTGKKSGTTCGAEISIQISLNQTSIKIPRVSFEEEKH